ncbi:MAG TPA: DnaD domain protein [Candidatus Onthovivens sp.]|nr:DnaD domain protein [Candidatus Onthovivens sp.]
MEDFKKYFIQKRGFLPKDYQTYLNELYLPILGYKAIFLYQYLIEEEASNRRINELSDLLKKTNFTYHDFLINRRILESVGLINSYKENSDSITILLNSCYTPDLFFNNLIFYNLLLNSIGEKELEILLKKYKNNLSIDSSKEISATFNEVFKVDLDSFTQKTKKKINLITNQLKPIKNTFETVKLIEYFKEFTNIRSDDLSEEELEKMASIGTLYSLDPRLLGDFVTKAFIPQKPFGERIDITNLLRIIKKEISLNSAIFRKIPVEPKINIESDSEMAKLINYYNSVTPRELLKARQEGLEFRSDLTVIDFLGIKCGFSNPMINAILDYALDKTNNDLSINYIDKMAATLKRKKVANLFDVLNVLYKKYEVKTSSSTENNPKKTKEIPIFKGELTFGEDEDLFDD